MTGNAMDASWFAGLPKLSSTKEYDFQAFFVLPPQAKLRPVCALADGVHYQVPKTLWKWGLEAGLALQDLEPPDLPKMSARSFFEACLEAAEKAREPIDVFQQRTGEKAPVEHAASAPARAIPKPPPAATKSTTTSPLTTIGPRETPSPTAETATPSATRATPPPPVTPSPTAAPSSAAAPSLVEPPATVSPRAAPPTTEGLQGATLVGTTAPHIHHDAAYHKGLLTRRRLARKRQQERKCCLKGKRR